MNKQNFKKSLGAVLNSIGFVGKGQSWFKNGQDAIVVLNIQKSDYEEKYYVNCGIWLKEIEVADFPPEHKCHLQVRLTSLFPEDAAMIERACSLTDGEDEMAAFVKFLNERGAPMFDDFLSMGSLRMIFSAGSLRRALIMKSARDILLASP